MKKERKKRKHDFSNPKTKKIIKEQKKNKRTKKNRFLNSKRTSFKFDFKFKSNLKLKFLLI